MDGSESTGNGPGGTNLVIVAIPPQDDYVWKISSEKVPHLTLLFLGEPGANAQTDRIAQFLQHTVATSLRTFGMDVEGRGELGPNKADVLFFRKDYIAKELLAFRSYLLQNDDILRLYNSVEQYAEWTPHLTLGYPETPAHPDNRDYPGIKWVNFDRVALWTGDYEGPEFRLKDRYAMEVSMSDVNRGSESVADILEHYGVKGMHWGVRKSDTTSQRLGLRPKGSAKPTASEDKAHANASAAKIKRGNTDALSNKELQQLVNRMNLEQQYSRLSSQSGTVKRGQQGVKDVLAVGKTVNEAAQFANTPMGKGIGRALKKAAVGAAVVAGKIAAKKALKR